MRGFNIIYGYHVAEPKQRLNPMLDSLFVYGAQITMVTDGC